MLNSKGEDVVGYPCVSCGKLEERKSTAIKHGYIQARCYPCKVKDKREAYFKRKNELSKV